MDTIVRLGAAVSRVAGCLLLLLPAVLAHPAPIGADDGLAEVKITTQASVDSSSLETIVKGVCRPGMTDEQKVIALFNWFERSVYHRSTPGDVHWNPHKVLNVYGGVTCGTQGCMMAGLCRAAGYNARVTADANGGHTYYEVFYGGAWHGFDSMNRFFVYTRGEPRQIASFEAIDKDPSLAVDAAKENRACPGFLFHGDDPAGYVSSKHQLLDYKPLSAPALESLSLVPGERITWYWYNTGKSHPSLAAGGMEHSCSRGADLGNPVNFPFWEPYYYETPGCAPDQKKRRMYSNGEICFEPDLSGRSLPPGFSQLTNLAGPGLVPQEDKPGIAMIHLRSPYLLVGAALKLKAAGGAGLSALQIAVTRDGKTFSPVAGALTADGVLDLTPEVVSGCNYGFGVRLTLPDRKSAIAEFKLDLAFMHNKYVGPFLAAGENAVKFSTKNPEALAACPVRVEYAWQEGPNWDKNEIKRAFQAVNGPADCEWKLKVGGEKIPRMKSLTLSAGAKRSAQGK